MHPHHSESSALWLEALCTGFHRDLRFNESHIDSLLELKHFPFQLAPVNRVPFHNRRSRCIRHIDPYLRLYHPIHLEKVSISTGLTVALASFSIFSQVGIRLAPTPRPLGEPKWVISFRQTILCTFRVILSTGFLGGAYWSSKKSPIP